MKKNLDQPRDEITFSCKACVWDFKATPSRVEDHPEAEHHPWKYFGLCTICGQEAEQAIWERSLFKAWTKATGPRTEAGIAATAKNLDGHPTPEEALRTRFNAMKHGMNARVANYFPAKPDGYSFCTGCTVEREWCRAQPACVKKTELFMLHHAAMEQKKPGLLAAFHADFQASLMGILQMIVQQIVADGVQLKKPVYLRVGVGDDERIEIADYVDETGQRRILYEEVQAHPLFRPLGELLSKNNLSLADMGITQKAIEREEESMGLLAAGERKQESMDQYAQAQAAALTNLAGLMAQARENRKRDPVLIEHDAQEGGRA